MSEKIVHQLEFRVVQQEENPDEQRGVFTLDSNKHFLDETTWYLSDKK